MRTWVSRLLADSSLPAEGYRELLRGGEDLELRRAAECVTLREFGRGVYVRALIELTNRCRNNCYYCGIRVASRDVERYTLSRNEVLSACGEAYTLGFRTFVLQGGEREWGRDGEREWARDGGELVELVGEIHGRYPKCAITLSLGEMERDMYERLFEAGASRYLLRHETYNRAHYELLHPASMSWAKRMEALDVLKDIGYQVGVGMMVGSPYQCVEHLVEDLLFIERFRPKMVGIGPFIPHHATPFATEPAGDLEMTLRLISIVRLINPRMLIPSTTALATLCEGGRERGILAGANVVMPNVTPANQRNNYTLYDNKAAFGSESAEGLQLLREQLNKIDREINFERGDYSELPSNTP